MLQLKLSKNAKNRKPIGTNTHKKCYNSNCQKMRKTVNRLGRILAKNGTTRIVNKCEKLKPVGTNTRKKWYNSNCQQIRKNLKTVGTNTHKKFYNSNCQQMRKTVNRLGRILAKNGTTQIANKCEKT